MQRQPQSLINNPVRVCLYHHFEQSSLKPQSCPFVLLGGGGVMARTKKKTSFAFIKQIWYFVESLAA
jgi:hypothetical protein